MYRIEVTKEHLANLDAAALAAEAASSAKLGQALEKLGSVELLYSADQVFAADGRPTSFRIARETPYVAATSKAPTGEALPTVAREKVGAEFNVGGFVPEADARQSLQLNLNVDLSFMTPSSVSTSAQPNVPMDWRVSQSYGGTIQTGKPAVLITLDGAPPVAGNRAVAIVTVVTCAGGTP